MMLLVAWQYLRLPADVVDDAYIYLRYAQNILASEGWVFNPGEAHNTATSPLWVVWLVALGGVVGVEHLATLSYAGSMVWLLVMLALLYGLLRPAGRAIAGAAVMTAVLSPHMYRTLGLPTTMHMSLLFATLLAYRYRRWNLMFTGLALLPLVRMENGLLLPLVAALAWRRDGVALSSLVWRSALATLPTAAWLLYSVVTFGRPFPVSLDAKLWQTESGDMGTGWVYLSDLVDYTSFLALPWARLFDVQANIARDSVAEILPGHLWVMALILLTIPLLIVGAVRLVRGGMPRGAGVMVVWALVHTLVYGFVLNVPGYPWYFTLAIIAGTWLVFGGLVWGRRPSVRFSLGAVVLLGSYLVLFVGEQKTTKIRSEPYEAVASWLRENTPEDAIVVHHEPGHIAFASRRRCIDRLALTTPQYLDKLRLGQSDLLWVGSLREPAPLYYLALSGQLPSPFARTELTQMLVYDDPGDLPIQVYHFEPSRFLLPPEGATSVFDVQYRLEGPELLSAQTLIPVDPGRRIAPAILLHPLAAPAAGAVLVIELPADGPRRSMLGFDAAFLVQGGAVTSDGVEFSIEVKYGDGSTERQEGAHRPESGREAELRRFEFPLRSDAPVREIRIWPHDSVVTHDWWALCQPILR